LKTTSRSIVLYQERNEEQSRREAKNEAGEDEEWSSKRVKRGMESEFGFHLP
jgi:hypothetical protein